MTSYDVLPISTLCLLFVSRMYSRPASRLSLKSAKSAKSAHSGSVIVVHKNDEDQIEIIEEIDEEASVQDII